MLWWNVYSVPDHLACPVGGFSGWGLFTHLSCCLCVSQYEMKRWISLYVCFGLKDSLSLNHVSMFKLLYPFAFVCLNALSWKCHEGDVLMMATKAAVDLPEYLGTFVNRRINSNSFTSLLWVKLCEMSDNIRCDGNSISGQTHWVPCDGKSVSGQTHKQTWVTWYRVMGSLLLVKLTNEPSHSRASHYLGLGQETFWG